ncbi:ABC transporter, partial [Rhodococcus rhodochrous]
HATVRPQDRGSHAPAGALALAVSVPITFVAMGNATLSQEQHALRTVLFPDPDDTSQLRDQENRIIASFGTERRIADHLDALDLPPGSVVMDTVYGFAVLTATDRPEQFVLPSDADFTRILNDPAANGVRYLLTVPNEGRGVSDAVNRRYPTVFETGADIATLDLEIPNDGDNQPTWRLYRIG